MIEWVTEGRVSYSLLYWLGRRFASILAWNLQTPWEICKYQAGMLGNFLNLPANMRMRLPRSGRFFFYLKSLVKLILILLFSLEFRSARISRHSSVIYAVRQPRKWTGHSNPSLNDILDSKYYPIAVRIHGWNILFTLAWRAVLPEFTRLYSELSK